jgi:hypothetical protein
MSQRGHWPLLIRTRYVCTCVGAFSEMSGGIREIKAVRWGAYYYSLVLNVQLCKYDMYKSSLRHIHDPVLSSLKRKGICLLFPSVASNAVLCDGTSLILPGNYLFYLSNSNLSCVWLGWAGPEEVSWLANGNRQLPDEIEKYITESFSFHHCH